MTGDLRLRVLNKLAKELAEEYGAYKNWKEMTEGNYWACSEIVVERAVDLAIPIAREDEKKKVLEEVKKEFVKQIKEIPLGEEGSLYNGVVNIFKEVFGIHSKTHFSEIPELKKRLSLAHQKKVKG